MSIILNKTIKEKQFNQKAILSHKIKSKLSVFPLKKFFEIWRGNFYEAKNFESDVVSIFFEQKIRKLLHSWHELTEKKSKAKIVAAQRKNMINFRLKRGIFTA